MASHPLTDATVDTEEQLRDLIGHPSELVCTKVTDALNDLTRQYVERSPFLCIATADAAGACDLSPRGDPAGFVRILDEHTLLLPERPGNRIADTLTNILANPHVGLLFLVPGATETFRVNGRATLTTDADLLAPCAVEGTIPRLGIIVDIDEAYTQCSKALLRSSLWDPERFVTQADLPSNGQIMRAINGPLIDPDAYDAERAQRYARRENFY
ncbi:MAG: pyridoxamine 5'-phosphate oxidase family protein [Acidimicrobiia bacterium]